jgi:hypothetical protein
MKTAVNEATGVLEAFLPGTILSINDSDVKSNEKGTQYKKCMVSMEYPDGTTEETQSIFYVNAQAKLPEVYKVGAKVELAIQIEGNYAGNSVVQAPAIKRIDVAKLTSFLGKVANVATNAEPVAAEA